MSLSSARRRVAPLLAATLATLVVATGCSAGDDAPDAEPAPEPLPTTVAQVDPTGIEVPRIDFCALVPEEVVTTALDGEVRRAAPRATDLPVQETGCTWRGDGVVARAWVFSRPVGEDQAAAVAAAAAGREGCRVPEGAAAYGDPGGRQVCRVGEDRLRDRWAGRFGDSWLTCELEGPRTRELVVRAEAWCAQLAVSLDAAD